jgi:hypothetical protein
MGQALVPTSRNLTADPISGFLVIDVIRIDPNYNLGVSGLVVVLADFLPSDPGALVGRTVEIPLQERWTLSGEIAGIRVHGSTSSILLTDWPDDFPPPRVGWRVEIPSLGIESTTKH